MSLYRQYRPQTFQDVTGQEPIVTTLTRAVEQDRIAHAYLFSGPRGTGKTSVARILARHILTRGMEDQTLKQQIEQAVLDGNLVDLVEIDAASNRGIDDIRDLVEKIQFAPVVARAKVYIVDEVHMLTREAFNALLKTLEEPPPYAYFILATTELQKIPPTIQSRCQRFPFRAITEEQIVARLRHIAGQEGMAIDEPALRAIAHAAQGGLRDAISLLDQLRSLPAVTAEDVRARTGESGHERLEELLAAVRTGEADRILQIIRAMEDSGTSLEAVARKLLLLLRTELHRQAEAREPLTGTAHAIEQLLEAVRQMRSSPVPGLALEAALLNMASREKSPTPPLPPLPPVPSTHPATSGDLPIEHVFQAWPGVVNRVQPPSVKMSLKDGRVSAVRGTEVTVAFTSAFHRDRVKHPDSHKQLEDLLSQALGTAVTARLEVDAERTPAPADPGMVDLAAEANDVFAV